MSFVSSWIRHKKELNEAKDFLIENFGIEPKSLIATSFNVAECAAILNKVFISLPIIKTVDGYYIRLDSVAEGHFTGIRIEDNFLFVETKKYIIDSRFFDADAIRKWCQRKGYEIN